MESGVKNVIRLLKSMAAIAEDVSLTTLVKITVGNNVLHTAKLFKNAGLLDMRYIVGRINCGRLKNVCVAVSPATGQNMLVFHKDIYMNDDMDLWTYLSKRYDNIPYPFAVMRAKGTPKSLIKYPPNEIAVTDKSVTYFVVERKSKVYPELFADKILNIRDPESIILQLFLLVYILNSEETTIKHEGKTAYLSINETKGIVYRTGTGIYWCSCPFKPVVFDPSGIVRIDEKRDPVIDTLRILMHEFSRNQTTRRTKSVLYKLYHKDVSWEEIRNKPLPEEFKNSFDVMMKCVMYLLSFEDEDKRESIALRIVCRNEIALSEENPDVRKVIRSMNDEYEVFENKIVKDTLVYHGSKYIGKVERILDRESIIISTNSGKHVITRNDDDEWFGEKWEGAITFSNDAYLFF